MVVGELYFTDFGFLLLFSFYYELFSLFLEGWLCVLGCQFSMLSQSSSRTLWSIYSVYLTCGYRRLVLPEREIFFRHFFSSIMSVPFQLRRLFFSWSVLSPPRLSLFMLCLSGLSQTSPHTVHFNCSYFQFSYTLEVFLRFTLFWFLLRR